MNETMDHVMLLRAIERILAIRDAHDIVESFEALGIKQIK